MLKNEDTNKIKYLVSHFLFLFVVIFSIFAFSTITSQAYVKTNLSDAQLQEVNEVWGEASNPDRFPHFLGTNSQNNRYPYGLVDGISAKYSGKDYRGDTWDTYSQTAGPYLSGKYSTTQSAMYGFQSVTHSGDFVIVTQGYGNIKMDSWIYGETPSEPKFLSNTNVNTQVKYFYVGLYGSSYVSTYRPTQPGTYRVQVNVGADKENYLLGYSTTADFTIHARSTTSTTPSTPEPDPDPGVNVNHNGATIAKHLKMTSETQLPDGITFKFDFTKICLNDDTGKTAEMPEIGSVSAVIDSSSQKSEDGGLTIYKAESNDFIAKFLAANGNKAPADGTYRYRVTEANSVSNYELKKSATINEEVFYSNMTYVVDIIVKTDEAGNVTITTIVNKPNGEKADPTPGSSNMIFENTFVRTFTGTGEDNVSLRVKKIVKSTFGDGDLSQIFKFHITVFSATTVGEGKTYAYRVVDATGTVHQEGTLTSGTATEFSMGHNYTLLVDGLEVGATYTIKEDGLQNWTASYTINGGDRGTGRANEGITIENKKILDQQVNDVEITNTYNSQTPTGVLMSNLPFNAMVILSVGILTLIAITNSKKKAKRA